MINIEFIVTKWLSLIVFKKSSENIKNLYRKIERTRIKLIKIKCHLSFNETCIINKLLPTYINVETMSTILSVF